MDTHKCIKCGHTCKSKNWEGLQRTCMECGDTMQPTYGHQTEPAKCSAVAPGYKLGQHVCFVMEDQCEVRGIVRDINDYPDFRELQIELDDNEGWYYARLRRR